MPTPPQEPAAGRLSSEGTIDWEGVERSSEFQDLVKARRRFVVPATIFFFVWYFGFIGLAGWAPGFMGESVYQGLTVGYLLALTQFLMTWGLGWWYLRRSDRDFDPLVKAVVARATEGGAPRGSAPAADEGRAS